VTEQLLGHPVASAIQEATRAKIREFPNAPGPKLVSVHRATTSPFSFYLKQQARAAETVGIGFEDHSLDPSETPESVLDRLRRLNADPSVDAVLLEHPLPPPIDYFAAVSELRPEKDVDGVGAVNLGHLLARRPIQVPAVARAAVAIAHHYHLPIQGQRVAVLGRSETVGLPLALLLLLRGEGGDATVTIAHSQTPNLAEALRGVSVIFSCVGRPGLLTRANVAPGTAVVDIGLSSLPDPARPSGVRAVGDADAVSLDGWASALTPVPGGVGPVTVAQLMWNAAHGWSLLRGDLR
jgi:methylenetetrahydrofolate dehydrogenase (NADP+) / methenyltetrahydrofolate cyclohydrolase